MRRKTRVAGASVYLRPCKDADSTLSRLNTKMKGEQRAASSSPAAHASEMIIVNRHSAAVIRTPHGSEIRPLVDRTTSPIERCSLAEEVLPAGARVGRHYHLETEEVYYILQGAGRMTINSEERDVASGDAVFIPRGAAHTLENTGQTPMTILLVCGPAYTYEDHRAGEPASGER